MQPPPLLGTNDKSPTTKVEKHKERIDVCKCKIILEGHDFDDSTPLVLIARRRGEMSGLYIEEKGPEKGDVPVDMLMIYTNLLWIISFQV